MTFMTNDNVSQPFNKPEPFTNTDVIDATNNEVVVVQNEENNGMPKSVATAIAEVGISSSIVETTSFQQVLIEIPTRVQEANVLLKEYRDNPDTFLDNVDDDALDVQLASMTEIFRFVRDIDDSRTEIRRYMNGIRDNVIATLDKRLGDASYNQLEQAQQDIRQLRKDVVSDRSERRWKELLPTFEANAARYPDLQQYAPELLDFSQFRVQQPKSTEI